MKPNPSALPWVGSSHGINMREDIKRWMKLYDIINIEFLTN